MALTGAERASWPSVREAEGFCAAHRSRPSRLHLHAADLHRAKPGREFGTNVERNAVHRSDSKENAAIEIAYFFSETQIQSFEWKR